MNRRIHKPKLDKNGICKECGNTATWHELSDAEKKEPQSESEIEIALGEGQMKEFKLTILNGETLESIFNHSTVKHFLTTRDFREWVKYFMDDYKTINPSMKSYVAVWISPNDGLIQTRIVQEGDDFCEA